MPFRLGDSKSELTPELSVDLRRKITELLDVVGPDSGLLMTIDEVHMGARAEMHQVAAVAQHLVREGRQFAIAMAGLPSSVSSLLSDDPMTCPTSTARS